MELSLREVEDADLDLIFAWGHDPGAVAMAAFTSADPADREAFDRHQRRIRADPSCTVRAIEVDGALVGTVGSFTVEDEREVTYWIDPSRWGRGIAGRALAVFLETETTRPLHARVAAHNAGSARVLARAGFVRAGQETAYAAGVGHDVVEHLYVLERRGRQWHYWPCADGSGRYDAWDAGRLEELARHAPTSEVQVATVAELDTAYWTTPGEEPTVRMVVEHARLALEVDTSRPVVLGPDGRVMDGMHRIVRALLEGRTSVPGVRLDPLPDPDARGVELGSLS